jgi:hypothetical protein
MGTVRNQPVKPSVERISSKAVVKTTLVVTDVLNRNLEIYSAIHGMTKNDAVVKCIQDQLSASGFKPDQYPREVVYR